MGCQSRSAFWKLLAEVAAGDIAGAIAGTDVVGAIAGVAARAIAVIA